MRFQSSLFGHLQKVPSSSRHPRTVFDLRGNVLLVQRFYVCRRGGLSPLFVREFSNNWIVTLFSRRLFSNLAAPSFGLDARVNDFVNTQVVQGVNFLQIGDGMASLNYHKYSIRSRTISDCQQFHEADCLRFQATTRLCMSF